MKQWRKRIFSLIMTLVLVAGLTTGFPLGALAEEPAESEPQVFNEAVQAEDEAAQAEAAAEQKATSTDVESEAEDEEEVVYFDADAAVAKSEEETEKDTDIFDLIDPSINEITTAGTDQLPYGENHTLTLSELMVTGSSITEGSNDVKSRLYGHAGGHKEPLKSQKPITGTHRSISPAGPGPFLQTNAADRMVAIEGDFTGTGRKSEVATLSYSSGRDMRLHVGDAKYFADSTASSKTFDSHLLVKFGTPASNNPSFNTNHTISTTNAGAELHLETADLDGDGYDEILLLMPNYSDSTGATGLLVVYSLINPSSLPDWKQEGNWRKSVYTINIGFGRWVESTSAEADKGTYLRTHSMSVGDLNGDGKDDVAIMSSELHVHPTNSNNDGMRASLQIVYGEESQNGLFSFTQTETHNHKMNMAGKTYDLFDANKGSSGKLLTTLPSPDELGVSAEGFAESLKKNAYGVGSAKLKDLVALPINLGVDIVNADGAAGNELLIGYDVYLSASGTFQASVGFSVVIKGTQTAQCYSIGYCVEQSKYNAKTHMMERIPTAGNTSNGYTMMLYENLKAYDSEDNRISQYGRLNLYYTNKSISSSSALTLRLNAVQLTAAMMDITQSTPYLIVGGNQHVLSGGSYRLIPKSALKNDPKSAPYPYCNNTNIYGNNTSSKSVTRGHCVMDIRPAIMSEKTGDEPTPVYGFLIVQSGYDNSDTRAQFVSGTNGVYFDSDNSQPSNTFSSDWVRANASAFCLPDTDMDSPTLRYSGYQFLLTDPKVVAALAAPPYAKDIKDQEDTDTEDPLGYNSDLETIIAFKSGNGAGTSQQVDNSLGGYVSAEAEIGFMFASAVVETEASFQSSWTTMHESMTEEEVSTEYKVTDRDAVIVLTYPIDVYTYEMTYPTNEDGSKVAVTDYLVHVPHAPVVKGLSMNQYNKLYQTYPDILPNIAEDVFIHEVGYPDTYRYNAGDYAGAWLGKEESLSDGTAPTVKLSITKTDTTADSTTNSVDFKAGGGAKAGVSNSEVKATAGIMYGHSDTKGKIVTNTVGREYSGTLPESDLHLRPPYNSMRWSLLQFNYRGVQEFPVVTYRTNMTRTASSLPYLPEDYGTDDENTTDKQVAVYWTPSRDDTIPGTNTNVTYRLFRKEKSSIGAADPVPMDGQSYDPRDGVYRLIDTDVAPNTTYQYYIACRAARAASNSFSIQTKSFDAATNPDDEHDYYFTTQPTPITLRPKDTVQLSAQFANNANLSNVKYLWQFKDEFDSWVALDDVKGNDGRHYTGSATNTLTFNTAVSGLAGTYRLRAKLDGKKDIYSDEVEVGYARYGVSIGLECNTILRKEPQDVTVRARVSPDAGSPSSTVTKDTIVRFVLTKPNGGTSLFTAKVNQNGVAEAKFHLPSLGMYSVDATYNGDGTFDTVAAETLYLNKTGGSDIGNILTAYLPKNTYTYGDTAEMLVKMYNNANSSGVDVDNPIIEIFKYEGTQPNSTSETGWVNGKTVTFRGVGKYRFKISAPDAVNSMAFDVSVSKRDLTYNIPDVNVFEVPKTLSLDDLSIETEDTLLAGDEGYTKEDLYVYKSDGTVMEIGSPLPEGIYYIGVKDDSTPPNPAHYNVTYRPGVYTVRVPTVMHTVTFGAASGAENMGKVIALEPRSLKTGGGVPTGDTVILQAKPAASYYEFESWDVTPDTNVSKKGDTLTISNISDGYSVTANFKPAGMTIYPANAALEPGGEKQFSVALPQGLPATVYWKVEGNLSAATAISGDGLLSVAKLERARSLTVTVTSTEDERVYASATVTIGQPDLSLVVTENGEVINELTMNVGASRNLAVVPVPDSAVITEFDVTSANTKTARVSNVNTTARTFTVEGVNAGLAELSITLGDGDNTVVMPFSLRVLGNDTQSVSARLNKTQAALKVGKTVKLTPTYTPAKTPIASVEWKTDSPQVATVDDNGTVTAIGPGTAVITLTATPWNATGPINPAPACTVTVSAPATGITLHSQVIEPSSGNFGPGDPVKTITLAAEGCANDLFSSSFQLAAKTIPANTTDEVKWKSSNETVATVSQTGTVTSRGKAGRATITATVGGKKATCKVTVVVPVPERGISIAGNTSTPLELLHGKSITLKAIVANHTSPNLVTTNKKVIWSSSDSSVATVSASGKVTARTAGATWIFARSQENPAISASRFVSVEAPPLTSIKFSQKAFTMKAGTDNVLSLTYNNGGGMNGVKGVTITSSRPEILYFTGTWASEDGSTYTPPNSSSYETDAPITAAALPPGQTDVTVVVTAEVTNENGSKLTTDLKVKVTSNNVTGVSTVALTSKSKKKAPGCGPDNPEWPGTPLAVGSTYTPSVSIKPSKATNKNMIWDVELYNAGTQELGAEFVFGYVFLNRATGKVTPRRPTGDKYEIELVGTPANPADAATIEPVRIRFKTVTRITRLAVQPATAGASTALQTGDTLSLKAVAAPDDASWPQVRWSSSNTKVVSVISDTTGSSVTVQAEGAGKATIQATALDGSKKTARISVSVKQQVADISISNTTSAPLGVKQGRTLRLKAQLNAATTLSGGNTITRRNGKPSSAQVEWRVVSGGEFISLNTKTGTVKGLADGTACIEVLPKNQPAGSYSTSATVHRMESGVPVAYQYTNRVYVKVSVPAKSVKINQKAFSVYGDGQSLTLDATTNPGIAGLTAGENVLTWSMPANAALEFENGGTSYTAPAGEGHVVLKTKTVGTVTPVKLTVTTASGKKASVTIKVTTDAAKPQKVQGLSLEKSAVWVQKGKSTKIVPTLTPKSPAPGNKNVKWSIVEYSVNDVPVPAGKAGQVAVVDQNGKVTARGQGYAVVTASSMDGNYSASCTVYCVMKN